MCVFCVALGSSLQKERPLCEFATIHVACWSSFHHLVPQCSQLKPRVGPKQSRTAGPQGHPGRTQATRPPCLGHWGRRAQCDALPAFLLTPWPRAMSLGGVDRAGDETTLYVWPVGRCTRASRTRYRMRCRGACSTGRRTWEACGTAGLALANARSAATNERNESAKNEQMKGLVVFMA